MIPEVVKVPFCQGIRLVLSYWYEIVLSRKDRTHRAHGRRYAPQRLDDDIIIIRKDDIAVFSHEFDDEFLLYKITELIPVLYMKDDDPLK